MSERSHILGPIRDEQGFTLVELLVVMLIIGLLAAIAIPTFFSQRDKGADSGAISNARNVQTLVDSCYLDNDDYAKCTTAAQLKDSTFSFGGDKGEVQVLPNPLGQHGVMVEAISNSGTAFIIYSLQGTSQRLCIPSTGESLPTGSCTKGGAFAAYGLGTW